VIIVSEDFIEIPKGSGDIWMNNLYVAVENKPPQKSSTILLHKDGLLFVTNCVFQGRDTWSRAIDVNYDQNNPGNPRLFTESAPQLSTGEHWFARVCTERRAPRVRYDASGTSALHGARPTHFQST
jgi:hypothetical protein